MPCAAFIAVHLDVYVVGPRAPPASFCFRIHPLMQGPPTSAARAPGAVVPFREHQPGWSDRRRSALAVVAWSCPELQSLCIGHRPLSLSGAGLLFSEGPRGWPRPPPRCVPVRRRCASKMFSLVVGTFVRRRVQVCTTRSTCACRDIPENTVIGFGARGASGNSVYIYTYLFVICFVALSAAEIEMHIGGGPLDSELRWQF